MNKLPMTAAENELTRRIRVERPRLIQRIQEAIADDTNLAENSGPWESRATTVPPVRWSRTSRIRRRV